MKLHYMPRFNVGVLLLTVIFIYLVISLYLYMTKEKVLTYEVSAGQLVSDNTFSGVILLMRVCGQRTFPDILIIFWVKMNVPELRQL